MNSDEAYELYVALRHHFNGGYDFFKYKGHIKRRQISDRNDKYFFKKLKNHKDPKGLIISNIISKDIKYAGELFLPSSEKKYADWLKRKQSFKYYFEIDLNKLPTNIDEWFVREKNYPLIAELFFKNEISPETIIILDNYLHIFKKVYQLTGDIVIWPETVIRLLHYKPFIEYDESYVKETLKARNLLTNTKESGTIHAN